MNKVLVLGGTGFVGRAFAAAWVAAHGGTGAGLLIPSRRPARAKALAMLPTVERVEADVHDPAQLLALMAGCDAVVNLVAVLHGNAPRFEQVHVRLAQRIASACVAAGVPRLVHVSALGIADGAAGVDVAAAPSLYLRSKAQGEQVLRAAPGLALTLLRPSVIFGAEDRFMNLFAALQALTPVLPLAGADARFQPVWVDDVAHAIVACLKNPSHIGKTFECAGPQVLTLRELVQRAGCWSGHARAVLPVPEWIGRLQAGVLGLLPGEPLMSSDNLASMRVPNVAGGRLPGLAELGIQPAALADVMAPWLAGGPLRANQLRMQAGR
jgi:uncharacterized protein YbjT (DUF2867 family)